MTPGRDARALLAAGDSWDWSRIELPEGARGRLHVELDGLPADARPVLLAQRVDGSELGSHDVKPGEGAVLDVDVAGTPAVLLAVRDRGRAKTAAVALRTRFTPAPDALEPNDDHGHARPIELGVPVSGALFPVNDRDVFAVVVPPGRQGRLVVTVDPVPAPIAMMVEVKDERGNILCAGSQCPVTRPAGEPVTSVAEVRAGRYLIHLLDGSWGLDERGYWHQIGDRASVSPYRMTVRLEDMPEAGEPNDAPTQATTLTWSVPVRAALLPRGDKDHYALELPVGAVGTIAVELTEVDAPLQLQLVLFGPRGDYRDANLRSGSDGRATFDVRSGGRHVLRILDGSQAADEHGWGHEYDNRSGAYTLRVRFLPAPDALEPNEATAVASPLAAGRSIRARLFPVGDVDHYRLALDGQGDRLVSVRVLDMPRNIQPYVSIFDERDSQYGVLDGRPGQPVVWRWRLHAPGRYAVRVMDGPAGPGERGHGHEWNNAASREPYRIRWDIAPEPDAGEPDAAPAPPRALELSRVTTGTLFPEADEDRWRFTLKERAAVRALVFGFPPSIAPRLRLLDARGGQVSEAYAQKLGPAVLSAELLAGDHVLVVDDSPYGVGEHGWANEWNNARSRLPYYIHVTTVKEPSAPVTVPETAPLAVTAADHADPASAWKADRLPFTARVQLYPPGDVDWIDLGELGPGVLDVDLDPDTPWTDPVLALHKRSGGEPVEIARWRDAFRAHLTERAPYLLKVSSARGHGSADALAVTVAFTGVEPPAAPAPLVAGAVLRRLLWTGETEKFALRTERPSVFTYDLSEPADVPLDVTLAPAAGGAAWTLTDTPKLSSPQRASRGSMTLTTPGEYVVSVAASAPRTHSALPYALAVSLRPAADGAEPDDPPRAYPLDGAATATVFPRGDADGYLFEVPQASAVTCLLTTVPRAIDAVLSLKQVGVATAATRLDQTFSGLHGFPEGTRFLALDPATYELSIADRGGFAHAAAPYALEVRTEPAPDAAVSGADPGGALALAAGKPLRVWLPPGQSAWLAADKADGPLDVSVDEVSEDFDPVIEVFAPGETERPTPTAAAKADGSAGATFGGPERLVHRSGAGRHLVKLSAKPGRAWSASATVLARFAPGGDAGAPRVLSVEPRSGARGVPGSARVTVRFDRPLAASSLDAARAQLSGAKSGAAALTAKLAAAGTAVVLTPGAPLGAGEEYTLKLDAGLAADEAGRAAGAGPAVSFATAPRPAVEPRLAVTLADAPPLAPGEHRVRVEGRGVEGTPELKLVPASGAPVAVALEPAGAQAWTGAFTLDAALSGTATLALSGRDAAGQPVAGTGPGAFALAGPPPPRPVAPPSVAAGAGGSVIVEWDAPPASVNVAAYRLLAGADESSLAPVAPDVDLDTRAFVDRPAAGARSYALAYVDRAGRTSAPSALSVSAAAVAGPPAPTSLTHRVRPDGVVVLEWKPPAGAVEAFDIYRNAPGEPFDASAGAPVGRTAGGVTRFEHRPGDGAHTYRVCARDAQGTASAPVARDVLVDTQVPRAQLTLTSFAPLPPATATAPIAGRIPPGKLVFAVELSEKTVEPPRISIKPSAGATVPIALTARDDTHLEGTVTLPASMADGRLDYAGDARDAAGNRGLHAYGPGLHLDVKPPAMTLTSNPPGPAVTGTLDVMLVADEPVARAPELAAVFGGKRLPVTPLTADRYGQWHGKVTIPAGGADGPIAWEARAIDLFGRAGSKVDAGPLARDATPPGPPLALRAVARKGGVVELTWREPAGEAVTRYRVYRGDAAGFAAERGAPAGETRGMALTDKPGSDRMFHYRVRGVDAAGNEGEASASVPARPATTPPPKPESVTSRVDASGDVRVAWAKPRLASVAAYRVYRVAKPRAGAETRELVLQTRETGCGDRPAVSGSLVYEVTSLDEVENESAAAASAPLAYDRTPPQLSLGVKPGFGHRIIWLPGYMSSHPKDLGEVVRSGKLELELSSDEPLAEQTLAWRIEDADAPAPLALEKAGPQRWKTAVTLPARPRDYTVHFFATGKDPDGNATSALGGTGHVLVDSTGPPAIAKLAASALAGGAVKLAWEPPGGEPAGEPTYSVLRGERTFTSAAGTVTVTSGIAAREHTDRPPREGEWFYAVVARDRAGNAGAVGEAVRVRARATAPKRPEGLEVAFEGQLRLTWKPVARAEPPAYRVYRVEGERVTAAQVKALPPVATTTANEIRLPAGRPVKTAFAVVAVDDAGNSSPPSEPRVVDLSARVPGLAIETDPPAPVRAAVRVRATATLPLARVPSLTLTPAGRRPIVVGLTATDASLTKFVASVDVGERTGDGPARWSFEGVTRDGVEGTEVMRGGTLEIDTRPPELALAIEPPEPVKPGPITLVVRPSEPLAEAPVLSFTPQGGTATAVKLTADRRDGAAVYAGAATIPGGLPDGLASVRITARDRAGNTGESVVPDRFAIVTHPPAAPGKLAAAAVARGAIRLTFTPPPPAGGQPPRLIAYELSRAKPGGRPERVARVTTLEHTDATVPEDGEYAYTVTAIGPGGLASAPTGPVTARSDRTPPAPPRVTARSTDAGIELAWEPAAPEPGLRYDLAVLGDDGRPESLLAGAAGRTFVHRPIRSATYRYEVRALDAAGNASAPGAPDAVRHEPREPAALLSLAPPAPVKPGALAVTLESTLPLSAPPHLTAEPTATGTPRAVPVRLEGAGRNWRGTVSLAPDPAVTSVAFRWEGTATSGGKAYAGRGFLSESRFPADFAAPAAALDFAVNVPRADDKAILKAGEYPVTVTVNREQPSPPVLAFTPRQGAAVAVALMPVAPRTYRGTFAVKREMGEGSGSFAVKTAGGADLPMTRGANVRIRTKAPGRPGRVRGTVNISGRVRIDWTPPLDAAGQPDPEVRSFRVFRSHKPILDVAGLTPHRVVERMLTVFDQVNATTTVHYAVQAVDSAGNAGPLGPDVALAVDREPPGPPRELRATLLETGIVKMTWKPPQGKKPIFYNVYLEKNPITTARGLEPKNRAVPITELYGAPMEDGRYWFAVTSVDESLEESDASPAASIEFSGTPPLAEFKVFPDVNVKEGTYNVSLTTTKSLIEPPHVEALHQDNLKWELRMTGAGSQWNGTITIGRKIPEGTIGLSWTGKSALGVTGWQIAKGPLLHVDKTPPLPPSNLKIAPDDRDTPGAVRLSWNSPKRAQGTTEVPYFYNVYRAREPVRSREGLAPVHVLRVTEKNRDEYVHLDVPPEDGTYHYAVSSLDLAKNESALSESVKVEARSSVPRVTIQLFTAAGGDAPVTRLGRGAVRVVATSSRPLSALSLAWFEWTADERLGKKKEPRHAVAMARVTTGTLWNGAFEIDRDLPEERDAHFELTARAEDGASGVFLRAGGEFTIDTTGPMARIEIPEIRTMQPIVKTNTLAVPPVRAGASTLTLATPHELAQPPDLAWSVDRAQWTTIALTGFGTEWSGTLEVPGETPNVTATLRYRGVDRAGNASTKIEARHFWNKTDETSDPPRVIENYTTVGPEFPIDTRPPGVPAHLMLEQRKLGIAVIKWDEPKGEPETYNLYRALVPMSERQGLTPHKTKIRAPVIVDDPPGDGNWFYAVTALDLAGNESELSECRSLFVHSIKPELKIKPVITDTDFVLVPEDEVFPPEATVQLRFPGGKTIDVDMNGESGELEEVSVPGSPRKVRGKVLPQLLELFNGTVEIVVHSPDPAGNVVEKITRIESKKISPATGGEVVTADRRVKLEIPPGVQPYMPEAPGKQTRVTGYEYLCFLRHENVPTSPLTTAQAADPRTPDPLPPQLEVVGTPYRIELNQNTEKPMELKQSVSQADFSQLNALSAKLRMKIPELGTKATQDVDYLKSRLKVVKWVPEVEDKAKRRAEARRGRWEIVTDVEFDKTTNEIIAPAKDVTTYVLVTERTPPTIDRLSPEPDAVVRDFRPHIKARVMDKGTGIASKTAHPIDMKLDGVPVDRTALTVDDSDPTEVMLDFAPGANLSPGVHVVSIRAQDVVENEAVRRWRFAVYGEPPKVLATHPKDGAAVGVRSPILSALLEVQGRELDTKDVSLTVDGAPCAVASDPIAGRLVARPARPLAAGTHRAVLTLKDAGGKTAHAEWSFATDDEPPSVERTEPATGADLGPGAPLVLAIRDAGAGVDPASLLLDVDGTLIDLRAAAEYDAGTGLLRYHPKAPFAAGEHRAFVIASDRHGRATARAIRFSAEPEPPRVTYDAALSAPLARSGAHVLGLASGTDRTVVTGPGRIVSDAPAGAVLLEPPAGAVSADLTVIGGSGARTTVRVDLAHGTVRVLSLAERLLSKRQLPYVVLVVLAVLLAMRVGWGFVRRRGGAR